MTKEDKKKKSLRKKGKEQTKKGILEHGAMVRRAIHIPINKSIISGHTSPILPAGKQNRFLKSGTA